MKYQFVGNRSATFPNILEKEIVAALNSRKKKIFHDVRNQNSFLSDVCISLEILSFEQAQTALDTKYFETKIRNIKVLSDRLVTELDIMKEDYIEIFNCQLCVCAAHLSGVRPSRLRVIQHDGSYTREKLNSLQRDLRTTIKAADELLNQYGSRKRGPQTRGPAPELRSFIRRLASAWQRNFGEVAKGDENGAFAAVINPLIGHLGCRAVGQTVLRALLIKGN